MKLNGPFMVDLKVLIINEKTGQCGEITLGMEKFVYLTEESIKQSVNEINFEANGLEGFRLMTKREAVNYVLTGSFETTYAVPGSQNWEN